MISKHFAVFAALGIGLMSVPQARAETKSMGQFEYENSCAACHGLSGTGGGPAAQFLSGGSAPDLTVIQKNYGGVFPVEALMKLSRARGDKPRSTAQPNCPSGGTALCNGRKIPKAAIRSRRKSARFMSRREYCL